MSVTNASIGEAFDEIADWLELDEANPFRIRAYRNAARTVTAWPKPLAEFTGGSKAFDALPGIGKDLAEKIDEIVHTGSCHQLKTLREKHPRGLRELLHVPGIGPKRAARLLHEAGISTPRRLLAAAQSGRIRSIKGFGPRSESDMRVAATTYLASGHRWNLQLASQQAEALTRYLQDAEGIAALSVAGSYRRCRETVGDLDVLAAAEHSGPVTRHFLAYPDVARVLSQGTTRCSVVLKNGMQLDLRVVKPASFGAAMVYFTGSKAHNLVLRRMAQQQGLKINEYGVYRGARRVAGDTEASVYATLDLPFIPPELRENRGELEAARQHKLPALIQRKDLQGDLHVHTHASDGHADIAAMAAAAKKAGLTYIAITDHSKGLRIAHGLDADALLKQIDAIDRFNDSSPGITVLKGIELEIHADGKLDLPVAILSRLDLVIGAVHSHFNLSRTRQTERIMRAMDSPCFSILAHPSGRLLGEREAYDIDLERLLLHALHRGCFMELNAQPLRLDLDDIGCRMAKDAGVRLAISSDSHDANGFEVLHFGIGQARRGWLEPCDVINTSALISLRRWLKPTMA